MIVAVTGARGQLGSELCRQLGGAAAALDLPEFDLTVESSVRSALDRIQPDVVINAAAKTQVDQAEEDAEECFRVNSRAVEKLVEECRRRNCALVQLSTDYVFGADRSRQDSYVEEDQPGPLGVYGRSKLEAEVSVAGWEKHFIVRTSGLYAASLNGPLPGRNFVDSMLVLGKDRTEMRIVSDQVCSPTYVPHLARAILFLIETKSFGLYHIVNTGEVSWYEFAREIFRLAGFDVDCIPIPASEYAARAPRPQHSVLDPGKYLSLGGPGLPSWRSGLADYFKQSEMTRQAGCRA